MRLCGENRRNIFQQTENTGKEHLMRQKTFGKWLAAAGILMAMTIWMVLPALAAPTVNSIRITFKDKYEDPGVIEAGDQLRQLRDRDHIRGVEQGCRKMES